MPDTSTWKISPDLPEPMRDYLAKEQERRAKAFYIGHMGFYESEDSIITPFARKALGPQSSGESSDQTESSSFLSTGACPVPISLEEAQSRLPFEIRLPTWVPEGLVWAGKLTVADSVPEIIVPEGMQPPTFDISKFPRTYVASTHWSSGDSDRPEQYVWLSYDVLLNPQSSEQSVSGPRQVLPGSVTAINVHNTPAAFLRPQIGFNPQTLEEILCNWVSLEWIVGPVHHTLRAKENVFSMDDLVRVAESIPVN